MNYEDTSVEPSGKEGEEKRTPRLGRIYVIALRYSNLTVASTDERVLEQNRIIFDKRKKESSNRPRSGEYMETIARPVA